MYVIIPDLNYAVIHLSHLLLLHAVTRTSCQVTSKLRTDQRFRRRRRTGRGSRLVMNTSHRPSSYDSKLDQSATSTSKFCNIVQSTARISIRATFLPTHTMGPRENGTKTSRFKIMSSLQTTSPPGRTYISWVSHLSGQKVSGRGEKYRESRWMVDGHMDTCVSSGTKYGPIAQPPVPFSTRRWRPPRTGG